MAKPTIAFIGLGIMGHPMAFNLLRAGYPLRIFNRTADKGSALVVAGAHPCASVAEAARSADACISIVTDAPDVAEVTFGPQGIVASAQPGTLVIDMSTIAPGAAREFAHRLRERELCPLDAPVSGGDIGAKQATLTIMVGGQRAAFDDALPIFRALGSRVTYLGPSGSGQSAKACNQILGAINLMGVCEALALARAEGLDLATMLEAVSGGAAGSWALEHLGPKVAEADYAPGFMVKLLQKDLGIVDRTATARRLPLPATALARTLFEAAAAQGAAELGTQALDWAYRALTGRPGQGSSDDGNPTR